MVIREYYEQLYAKILNNLEETDKFLESQNSPRLNHKEIKNMNKPITGRGWNGNQKPLLYLNSHSIDRFSDELNQIFKK